MSGSARCKVLEGSTRAEQSQCASLALFTPLSVGCDESKGRYGVMRVSSRRTRARWRSYVVLRFIGFSYVTVAIGVSAATMKARFEVPQAVR